jgi:hypothetical protein
MSIKKINKNNIIEMPDKMDHCFGTAKEDPSFGEIKFSVWIKK